MSASVIDAEAQNERAPPDYETSEPVRAAAAAAVPDTKAAPVARPVRPISVAPMPMGRPSAASAIERIPQLGNRALAEASYRLRRLGATTIIGIAAVVAAATLFISSNLPQSATVAALKAQLLRLTPTGKGAPVAVPVGAMLASLPSRANAPDVVAKIFEEAEASGIDLPRGQYEFLPPRDGVAARYRMTFPVHATYPKIREFMDRTLVALPAVAVEGLRIERKNVGEEAVDAELKLGAYVRSDP